MTWLGKTKNENKKIQKIKKIIGESRKKVKRNGSIAIERQSSVVLTQGWSTRRAGQVHKYSVCARVCGVSARDAELVKIDMVGW